MHDTKRKTIFLTSFHPLISRNILMGEVFAMLAEAHRIILLVPRYKAPYFEEHFSGPNVAVEAIDTKLTAHDLFFRKLILSAAPTRDLSIKRRVEFYRDRKIFSYLVSVIPAALFRGKKWYIRLLRALDRRTGNQTRFSPLFERYHPNAVVSTDVQNEIDVAFLRGAQVRGIRTVAMVRSWDNLTSKGIIRCVPGKLLVHNDILKGEAVRYSFIDPGIISVIGIPHYDRYKKAYDAFHDSAPSRAREMKDAFFTALQFDATKKLILFAPFGDRYIRDNRTDILILETLSSLDLNILVRLPPTDTVNFMGFKSRRATVRFYESGSSAWRGGKKINEVSATDEEHLIKSLAAADVVVTGQSTIAI
ncbi:MAG: hypothetical protein AAB518_02100, partial [Patescibacteria group bacterium]